MKPKVFIIILNWNGIGDTYECVNSLLNIDYDNYEILIVDNNSREKEINELKILSMNNPKVKLILNKQNLGFAGGNNIGIDYAIKCGAEYIMLLNNDTIVEKDFINPLLKVFEQCDNVGIVAPKINYYEEKNIIWSAGGKISRIRGSGYAVTNIHENKIKFTEKAVTFVSGCCMLIRREMFYKVGLLDENYFVYLEDADFCSRVINAGYKIIVSSQSKIYHKVSKSTRNKLNLLPLYYVTRNRLYFIKKNYPNYLIPSFLYISISMLLKSIIWIMSGNYNRLKPVYIAVKHFFKNQMGKIDYSSFIINY